MTSAVEVLVVGAGPTGLTLALQAHAHGARVRIVERRPEAFRPSRALILHPRTLEVLRPLGVTDALLARADTAPEAQLHTGSRVVAARLAELALPDTAFPHLSFARQMDVETVLTQALLDRGVAVERDVALAEVEDAADCARALLRSRAGTEQTTWDYVVGCDGPESTVRGCAGIGWQGGSYSEEVILADAELDTPLAGGVAHVAAGRRGLLFLFALGERATWRLLATRRASGAAPRYGQPGPPVPVAELQALLDGAGLDARITNLAWSARYGLQHRLAAQYRRGRLLLAGDAAHAHSPALGQGMNTGIQDAVNLGWKLAFAGRAKEREALLDSYEHERRRAARRVLTLTHAAFWAEASTGMVPSLIRAALVPIGAPAIPVLLARRRLVAEAVRIVSQLRMSYPDSPVSREGDPRARGGPRPGQRLPDATVNSGGRNLRLHALLARPGVHVLLQHHAEALDNRALGPRVAVHRLTSARGAGLVAVRPDGYVGFRCGTADPAQLRAWLRRIGAMEPAQQ